MLNKFFSFLLALVLFLPAGCAADGSGDVAVAEPDAGLAQLTGRNAGLMLLHWVVEAKPEHMAELRSTYQNEQPIDEKLLEQLERNGMRVIEVPIANLDQILGGFERVILSKRVWHGQVYQWSELIERPVAASGRAIAVDGRVRRYADGAIRLMGRSWTLHDEDGIALNVELLSQFITEKDRGLRRLLKPAELLGETFQSAGLQTQLAPGTAWILTAASPAEQWSADDSDDEQGQPSQSSQAIGPLIAGPPTVGEVLLSGSDEDVRGMLVFVPRFPPESTPTAEPSSSGPSGKAEQGQPQ